jgi:hypothetical protein
MSRASGVTWFSNEGRNGVVFSRRIASCVVVWCLLKKCGDVEVEVRAYLAGRYG